MKKIGIALFLLWGATPAQAQVSVTTTGAMTQRSCATPAISPTSYSAGQEVGPLIVLSNAFRQGSPNNGARLMSVALTTKSPQTAGFKLYQFDANPVGTTWSNQQVPSINPADVMHMKAPIILTAADSGFMSVTVYGLDNIGRAVASSSANDYWVIVATGSVTFTSTSDLSLCVTYQLD